MSDQVDPSTLQTIGVAAGVGEGVALGVVSYVLFEDPAFAAGIGLLAAVGGTMFVPYMMMMGAIQEGSISPDVLLGSGSVHSGALGIALSTGSIVGLSVRFLVESSAEPLAVAIVYAAVSFLALRYFLPWKDSFADARSRVQ